MTLGKFITLEGGEGAGKSTQILRLADGLKSIGIDTVVTREPGGSPGAEEIRGILVRGMTDRWMPRTEALLHTAARVEHVERTIRPALAEGRWVLCDRFADSTVAYQGYGHGLGRDWILDLHALVFGTFAPDLTLILDIAPDQGLQRATAGNRGEDRYERMGAAFHSRLRKGFLDIAQRDPSRCAVIDATGDIDEVQKAIRRIVSQRMRLPLP